MATTIPFIFQLGSCPLTTPTLPPSLLRNAGYHKFLWLLPCIHPLLGGFPTALLHIYKDSTQGADWLRASCFLFVYTLYAPNIDHGS